MMDTGTACFFHFSFIQLLCYQRGQTETFGTPVGRFPGGICVVNRVQAISPVCVAPCKRRCILQCPLGWPHLCICVEVSHVCNANYFLESLIMMHTFPSVVPSRASCCECAVARQASHTSRVLCRSPRTPESLS